jgi:pyrophosphatase PpaX
MPRFVSVCPQECLATIVAMRFRVVLFDLDGTLIDSGAIILASMRHATRTVLAREIDDEILMATVGGAGLTEQMRLLDAQRVDELVRVYREHNEPLHETLEACPGVLDVLPALRDDGRQLGIVTAKRRATVELAFAALPELEQYFDVVVGAEHTIRHKPDPEPLFHALAQLGAEPDDAAYVGDSPFDVRAAKAGGLHAVAVTWGGIHTEDRLRTESPDAVVHSPEELLGVL